MLSAANLELGLRWLHDRIEEERTRQENIRYARNNPRNWKGNTRD